MIVISVGADCRIRKPKLSGPDRRSIRIWIQHHGSCEPPHDDGTTWRADFLNIDGDTSRRIGRLHKHRARHASMEAMLTSRKSAG